MKHGRLLVVAVMGTISWALSEAIYRFAIVPRLPGWRSVPLWWWFLQSLPLICSVVLTGVLSRTTREALINGLCLVVPPVAILTAVGAISRQPVGHDVWVNDIAYWLAVGFQVTAGVVAVMVAARISRSLNSRRHDV